MNKHLLYLCIMTCLCLACAKEGTKDSLFEKSFLLATSKATNEATNEARLAKTIVDNTETGIDQMPSGKREKNASQKANSKKNITSKNEHLKEDKTALLSVNKELITTHKEEEQLENKELEIAEKTTLKAAVQKASKQRMHTGEADALKLNPTKEKEVSTRINRYVAISEKSASRNNPNTDLNTLQERAVKSNLKSQNNNNTAQKEEIVYKVLYEEPKTAVLLIDPKAHSKTYKQPDTIVVGRNVYNNEKKNRLSIVSVKKQEDTTFVSKSLSQGNEENYTSSTISAYPGNSVNNEEIQVRILNKERSYQTNKNYTFITQIVNKGETLTQVSLDAVLPPDWRIISISAIPELQPNERKLCLISFYIPTQSAPGNVDALLVVKSNNYVVKNHKFNLKVAANYGLEVFNLSAPKQLQAGELIEATYGIKNNGNTNQEIILSSRNTIDGERKIIIPNDSTVVVKLTQETDAKANAYRRISTNLEVLNTHTQRKYYKTQSVEVIPTTIKQKDPYLRYPIDASLYFSSYTNEDYHYSTLSAELRGNGFLDVEKKHHLNFTLRAPKKEKLRRFSTVDQYSLIYNYNNTTTLHLGDHSYYINRLGFGSRYGMGFKLDHDIKKWTLSAFYSKPRLYHFNKKPLYGVKAVYHHSDSLKIGLTMEKSEGNTYSYRNIFNQDGKGQIVTIDYDYKSKNTRIDAEVSTSFNNTSSDFATDLNLVQRFKNVSFSSYLILAGKNYLGNISNSLQLNNNLNYNNNGFNLGVGHAISRVNRRLDPVLFETEPYHESYYATLGYRFSNKHFLHFRFDKRFREDQLEPVNYKYQEYGFNYSFNYTDKLFTGYFGGRFAKTQNLLSEDDNYKDSYIHNVNVSYKIFKSISLRGGFNHIYTNRYGTSDLSSNYMRYNFGFNYNLMRRFSLNANYNSGFSPEESYKRREYINLNLRAKINKHHRFEVRANYFENPAVVNNKELFAYAKYTYSFGVGVKRMFDLGGVEGSLITTDNDINIKGIKVYTAGKTIVTDKYGNFEFNNLELGTNYIYIDESTLPMHVVAKQKNPIEVIVEKDKRVRLDLLLVKAGKLNGTLNLTNKEKAIETNLESYLKLENEDFTYYAESNKNGTFKFQNIVPGDYTFTVMRFKKNGKNLSVVKNTEISIKEGIETPIIVNVKGKERKIKFKNKKLNVVYND